MPGASRLNRSLGECDADHADNEFADAGTGDSGGIAVSGEGGSGTRRGVFEGFAGSCGCDGVGRSDANTDRRVESGV